MIEAEFWDYDSEDEMAAAVAGDVGFIIDSAIEARGNALIALPGGSTPGAIFEKLAEASVPWKKVTIIPTDDRLVAMDNELRATPNDSQHSFARGADLPDRRRDADYRRGAIRHDARCRICLAARLVGSGWGGTAHRSVAGPTRRCARRPRRGARSG